MKKRNYLNNKDILKEIHKSKNTFCSYVDNDYAQFDIILPDVEKINIRTIAEAKRINPSILAQGFEHKAGVGFLEKQVPEVDLVIDCSDNVRKTQDGRRTSKASTV